MSTGERITVCDGAAYRDEHGVWRHTDDDTPVPGARDMTLNWLYPDLVVVRDLVLVPDQLVRDNTDLAWVRGLSPGPTKRFDHEQSRGAPPTPDWTDVWPVPAAEWDRRNGQVLGIVVEEWTSGPLPRLAGPTGSN